MTTIHTYEQQLGKKQQETKVLKKIPTDLATSMTLIRLLVAAKKKQSDWLLL